MNLFRPFRATRLYFAVLVAAAGCLGGRADDRQLYESAVASLALGKSDGAVGGALRALEAAGTKAFPVLIAHVKDTTKASLRFQEARVDRFGNIEDPTIGRACFGILQRQVEDAWPKAYREYYILTPENVGTWWDKRKTKSLRALRLEAAQTSLDRAKKDFETDKSRGMEDTVKFLTAHLKEVQEN